jgi:hypothetical protein
LEKVITAEDQAVAKATENSLDVHRSSTYDCDTITSRIEQVRKGGLPPLHPIKQIGFERR